MSVAFCSKCHMVQLMEQPDPKLMFHDNYAFYSSSSKHMATHFENFAIDVINEYQLTKDSTVLEIGSNDGILLKHFASRGIGHLGVEPSSNVAQIAKANGVKTLNTFFDDKFKARNNLDVILAANVLCHISDIHSVMRAVKRTLSPNGVFIFEDPYLGDIIDKTSYDQIYDEHAFYFSASSVHNLVRQYGMEIIEVESQSTHGGSMRYTIANIGQHFPCPSVKKLLFNEYIDGLDHPETYNEFRRKVESSRRNLVQLLMKIKTEGGNIVGYGATAKSATITNYCGIGPEVINFICDTTPIKQGKFSPGVHIPVRPHDEFVANPPTHALLFAWNHANEIMQKEEFKGKWIVYVPEVKLL